MAERCQAGGAKLESVREAKIKELATNKKAKTIQDKPAEPITTTTRYHVPKTYGQHTVKTNTYNGISTEKEAIGSTVKNSNPCATKQNTHQTKELRAHKVSMTNTVNDKNATTKTPSTRRESENSHAPTSNGRSSTNRATTQTKSKTLAKVHFPVCPKNTNVIQIALKTEEK